MSFIVLKQDVVDVISILQTSNYGVQNFSKTPKVISQVSSQIKVVFALPKEKKEKTRSRTNNNNAPLHKNRKNC